MPLDPYHLTPAASLNRLRIVDIPGLVVPSSVKNKLGYELVSAHSLCHRIRTHSDALKLTTEQLARDDRELPPIFDKCLKSDDAEVRSTAYDIATQFTRNLGYLLLTLKRGDRINRDARPDWDESYWEYWQNIRTIRFGGGLLSGHMGYVVVQELMPAFAAELAQVGPENTLPEMFLTHYKGFLPLVGAARYLPAEAHHGVVLDFGASFVKRAYTRYESGTLSEFHVLPSVATQWTGEDHTPALFDFMATTIARTWQEQKNAGAPLSSYIPVSFASYVTNGQPEERQGGAYAALRLLSDNVEEALSEAVSQRLNTPIQVHLLHDGSAAAVTYAGETHTAVLMLGTAIGIGFPPPAEGLRPVSDHMRIL